MRFTELSETERVEKVKDTFIEILSSLAEDLNKVGEYVTIPAKPQAPNASTSDTEKAALVKAQADFDEKTAQVAKIKEVLSQVERPEGCFCGNCVTVKFGPAIPSELEFLIEIAQKRAEKATY